MNLLYFVFRTHYVFSCSDCFTLGPYGGGPNVGYPLGAGQKAAKRGTINMKYENVTIFFTGC